MSKILKNITASSVVLSDVGITIPASSSYAIQPVDYHLFAGSSDVVTRVGNSQIIVNDGSGDLSITDGIDLIKGIFQKNRLIGNTTGTQIGNIDDKLKVSDVDVLQSLSGISSGVSFSNISKRTEANVTTRNEFDLPGTTYTVPAGKSFVVRSFIASYDASALLYVRLKRQVGGTGPFTTIHRIVLMSGGQGEATISLTPGNGVLLGAPGDVFKITVESSLSKGTIFSSFAGSEI